MINYPAGQAELADLVARWSFRPAAQLVVGNGSAELIKMIGSDVVRDLTISVPTYNEYENTVPSGRVHRVPLDADTMQLDMDRFHAEIRRSRSNVAVVVSPNNPTSLAVPRDALLDLLRRLEGSDCLLLVDESFLEFGPAGRGWSLENEVDRFPNLAIMKSMTKVFGTLGLRLGYVLSANDDLIQRFAGGFRSSTSTAWRKPSCACFPDSAKSSRQAVSWCGPKPTVFIATCKTSPGWIAIHPTPTLSLPECSIRAWTPAN